MATKLAEKCTIMLDVGQGMMARVSLLSRNLASPGGRPHSLQNPEWAKLRKTLEKKFPEVNQTELSQMPAFETFQSAAGRIIDELGEEGSRRIFYEHIHIFTTPPRVPSRSNTKA